MIRVLFVDDEPSVLEALEAALYRDRRRWSMAFSLGAAAALEEIAHTPVDIVVSDMRMPGMDGAALLAKVRELYPSAIRFVLSGHADRDAASRALSSAHHFLSKPCEPVVLRGMLERASRLIESMTTEAVGRVLSRIPSLPPPPSIRWAVEAGTSNLVIAASLEGGLSLPSESSARFVRMTNSVLGLRSAAAQDAASSRLRDDMVAAMVVCAHAFGEFERLGVPKEVVDGVQEQSLLTAWLASGALDSHNHARTALTAGLLHDVGALMLYLVEAEAGATGRSLGSRAHLEDAEARLGVTHASLGAHLLCRWGLPLPVLEAVAHHDHPPPLAGSFGIAWAVHLADVLAAEAVRKTGGPARAIGREEAKSTALADLEGRMASARRQLMGHSRDAALD
jgi:DNA-binding NarL/FixJ family response regulator